MTLPSMTRDQVREVDRIAMEQYGVPGIVLMENAGIGATRVIDQVAGDGIVLIVCGGGNNGGDGYVVARHLELLGRSVRVVSLVEPDKLKGDAATNALIAEKAGIEIRVAKDAKAIREAIDGVGTIVDGMLGTGAQGALRGLYADAVNVLNGCDAVRIALDIPTGLDCDTGEASEPTFRAGHTVTFVAPKAGFDAESARPFIGEVHVVPIGAPKKLLESL